MKLNTLDKVVRALESLEPQVQLPAALIEKSRRSLQRMLQITRGEKVEWPRTFQE
jgi:quinolinate synthase